MLISEEEKNRILNLHKGNKSQYLTEDDKDKTINLHLLTMFTGLFEVDKNMANDLVDCVEKVATVHKVTIDPKTVSAPAIEVTTPATKVQGVLKEEPEKDTYWMITKANRDNLIKMGGTAEEIGKSATNDFKKYCK